MMAYVITNANILDGTGREPFRGAVRVEANRIAAVITLIPRATFEAMNEHETKGERIGTEYAMMRGTPLVFLPVLGCR